VLLPVGIAAETDEQVTVVMVDDSSVTVSKSDLLLPLDLPQMPEYKEQTREARNEKLRAAASKSGDARRGAALPDAGSNGGSDSEDCSAVFAGFPAQIDALDASAGTRGHRASRVPSRAAEASKKRKTGKHTAAAAAAELDDTSSSSSDDDATAAAAAASGGGGGGSGSVRKPAKRAKKERGSANSAKPAAKNGPKGFVIPKKARKPPTAVPGRPGIWQTYDSRGETAGFYIAPKSQSHLELSAATKHKFRGPFKLLF
jgi:hypothetical protein